MINLNIFLFIFLVFNLGNAVSATINYTDQSLFSNALGTRIIDTYDSPGYLHGDISDTDYFDTHSDSHMSKVFGETAYQATGFINSNTITSWLDDTTYCAGCNGSFSMSFLNTSISDSSGIYGVGFETRSITWDTSGNKDIFAYVEFGDLSYQNFLIKEFSFWGITSNKGIRSIHIGLENGLITTSKGITIDNLTLGAPVPLPGALLFFLSGIVGLSITKKLA